MIRKYLLILVALFILNGIYYSQNSDSSAIILDSQDTIIKVDDNKSLINPRNLELKQQNYWEAYAEKLRKPEVDTYEESLYKPMISLGIGTLSFFGDVGDTMIGKNRMDRNLFQQIDFTYTIRLINPINDYLDVAFYAMFATAFTFHIVSMGDEFGFQPEAMIRLFLPMATVSVLTNLCFGWINFDVLLSVFYPTV